MNKTKRHCMGKLAQAAAVLGLALGAVAAMPAAAEEPTSKTPQTGKAEAAQPASADAETRDKASNPCAVKKKKKKKGPCAVGG